MPGRLSQLVAGVAALVALPVPGLATELDHLAFVGSELHGAEVQNPLLLRGLDEALRSEGSGIKLSVARDARSRFKVSRESEGLTTEWEVELFSNAVKISQKGWRRSLWMTAQRPWGHVSHDSRPPGRGLVRHETLRSVAIAAATAYRGGYKFTYHGPTRSDR